MKTITGFFLISFVLLMQACSNKEPDAPKTKANFGATGFDVPAPANITLFNTSSNATSYKWYFGDGTTSTEFSPTHNFSSVGTYFMKLVATGPSGADSVCKVLYLGDIQSGQSTFSYFMDKCIGTPVNFSFVSLNPLSSNYAWDFGNGISSLIKNPIIQYAATGSYMVKFSSIVGGVRDTATLGITIN